MAIIATFNLKKQKDTLIWDQYFMDYDALLRYKKRIEGEEKSSVSITNIREV